MICSHNNGFHEFPDALFHVPKMFVFSVDQEATAHCLSSGRFDRY